ncbi:phosphate acyltransferase PlsX [Paenibacillus sp. NPDC056579]|uniref:phosphate acyltransferase PlsX n=1 Tax=Paenibacillus sp. NPDC056579 TaxID=3345871 RepID=UPI0036AB863D
MRIAIDAMGGDSAPECNVKGALMAAKAWKDDDIVLIGDLNRMKPWLSEDLPNVHLVHASETIAGDDEPVQSVRRKKDSSLVVAGRMVRDGEADAMVSAGNTGALVAMGLFVIGRIKGIERPALAQLLPTMSGGHVLVLDLGAIMDPTPAQLLQNAWMGHVYMSKVLGIDNPRIGLLNVGAEPKKGNELVKTAYTLLQEQHFSFVGNVESRDVLNGVCDVLVCDAFSGNILLKSFEGALGAITSHLKEEFTRSALTKLAASIIRPGLTRFMKSMDYRQYGGAPLFGIDGVCIKSHGSSNADAIKHAVSTARSTVMSGMVGRIASEISAVPSLPKQTTL